MQTNALNSAAAQSTALTDVDVGKDKGSAAALSQDFETFLQMLTVQLENQDPLNPVEASDYAVQLATFSGVEQQVKTNDLLTSLTEQIAQQNLGQYASWIGHDIRHTGVTNFEGDPIQGSVAFKDGADAAQLVVRNNTDLEVRRIDLTSEGDVTWDGLDSQGVLSTFGDHTLVVESFANGQSIGTAPVEIYSTILETQVADGQMELVLSDGTKIAPTDVVALR